MSGENAATPVPVILVSGVAEEPMAAATIALQWDLPDAVVVRHEVDPERELLRRTVSDVSGIQEQTVVDVEHAFINCAIRGDIVPTLERLAASGQWQAIIAQLPVSAEAAQVCRALAFGPVAPHVRVAAVVAALEGDTLVEDLLGDDLLVERALPVREDDERGVGETASAIVEYADLVATFGELSVEGWELLRLLARPGVMITTSMGEVVATELLTEVRDHDGSEDWVAVVRDVELDIDAGEHAWLLDLRSDRPFHPDRLQEHVRALGGGPHRSRGCFWLPSRPTQVCQWDGSGGMISIGPAHHWEQGAALTRIVVVGLDDGRAEVEQAFAACLLTDEEMAERGAFWEVGEDGFEPWLGPVRSLSITEV